MTRKYLTPIVLPADPAAALEAATKQYVDNSFNSTSWKYPVEVATTANITLTGLQTIDGYSLVAGERVLVKDQTTQSQNGIYSSQGSAWLRESDFDASVEIAGSLVYVKRGTVNAETIWAVTSPDTRFSTVVGTTNIVWSQWPVAANPNNPLGIIAVGSFTFGDGTALTNGAAMTNLLSATLGSGRRGRVVFGIRAAASGANIAPTMALQINGVDYGERWFNILGANGYNHIATEWIVNGDGTAKTYAVYCNGVSGVVGYSVGGYFYVEDVGPSVTPALPLSATDPPWTPLTLQNGWTFVGSGFMSPAYRKIGDIVSVRGTVNRTVTPSGGAAAIATLPVGFRPPASYIFAAWMSWNGAGGRAAVRVSIEAVGTITFDSNYSMPSGTAALAPVDHLSLETSFSTTA